MWTKVNPLERKKKLADLIYERTKTTSFKIRYFEQISLKFNVKKSPQSMLMPFCHHHHHHQFSLMWIDWTVLKGLNEKKWRFDKVKMHMIRLARACYICLSQHKNMLISNAYMPKSAGSLARLLVKHQASTAAGAGNSSCRGILFLFSLNGWMDEKAMLVSVNLPKSCDNICCRSFYIFGKEKQGGVFLRSSSSYSF